MTAPRPQRYANPKLVCSLSGVPDAMVIDAGARIYLGKDSYTGATTFRTIDPEVDGWLQTKAKFDPQ